MSENEYDKYFLHKLPDERRFKGFGKMPSMVAFTDKDIIEGSKYFSVMVMGPEAAKHPGHGPHSTIGKGAYDESFFFVERMKLRYR